MSEQEDDLEEVRPRPGVLERVGGVGVEEAAAVGAELLDRLLRRDRSTLDRLLDAGERLDRVRRGEVLDDPTDEEEDRGDGGQGQEDAERRAGQVDPEVADPVRAHPGEAADDRSGDGDARRRRDEVLDGEAEHLGGVPGGCLTRVGLPVGVRREGHRAVERRVPVHPPAQGPRQQPLTHEQGEEQRHRDDGEREDRAGVPLPALLGAGVDPDEPVHEALHAPVGVVGEDAVHPRAEGDVEGGEDSPPRRGRRWRSGVRSTCLALSTGPAGSARRGGSRGGAGR